MRYVCSLLRVPDLQCWGISHCKPFTFCCVWQFYLLHESRPVLYYTVTWGVETGEHFFPCWQPSLRIYLRDHVPAMIRERCANRVKVLTDRIVRTQAYPSAHGGFSDVWCCLLTSKRLPSKRVAVKAIRPVIANDEEFLVKKKAVKKEFEVWAGLRHPNVLPLYGVTDGFGPFRAFVCPWAANGTLSEYLEKFDKRLDLEKRLKLLNDVATGLRYLHSRNVVHGDLSGSNVLITSSGRACLSDFGLSTLVEVSDAVVPGVAYPGNIRWAAPELFENCVEGIPASQLQSQQADVYSFGSIMLQTLTGKLPFHGIRRVAEIVIMISRGEKPSREKRWDGRDIPEVLWEFVKSCWDSSPSNRPSSGQAVGFITEQLSRL